MRPSSPARRSPIRGERRCWRDQGCPTPSHPTTPQLRRWLSFLVDEAQLDEYLPLLLDELALGGPETRAPGWHKSEIAPDRPFTVAIIGAGMSGLAAAVRLQQAEVPFVLFERSEEIGGTWHDNVYPGCRVDGILGIKSDVVF